VVQSETSVIVVDSDGASTFFDGLREVFYGVAEVFILEKRQPTVVERCRFGVVELDSFTEAVD